MGVDPREVRALAARFGLRLTKARGQHFLTDPRWIRAIVDCAEVTPEDGVLEIGPGLGVLTAPLAERAGRVVAVEIDARLIDALGVLFSDRPNVTIVHADFLALDLPSLLAAYFPPGMPLKVVANLPYYITSPILFRLLEGGVEFRSITVMVQKEVAERLVARPGTKAYGMLTASVARYATPRRCFDVPAGAFFPPPRVASTVVHLAPYASPRYADCADGYAMLVAVSFQSRRKTLANNLRQAFPTFDVDWGAWLSAHGFDPRVRGEALSPDDFCRLGAALFALVGGASR
ncbi:MAG: 16S rRNA (adenine(1518)-N(6)/adenine(1519)-N(6))-dimethyltransferase RsmA [Hydrogenibacillus sp.]|nr:16S rRNA (adenine(1518)-N(6)/adenine(1519)-N(6))-dimethyltransferase RsmA [Hydrogenibacillus sp.]